ncbi:MAG: TPP-dependent pyruvate/acetoin dehydrogenase alpha subunit [Nitrospinales bacterium]|jgi:TPP-dependent pyruvate/acetoin dehydrogenase alpha subunit
MPSSKKNQKLQMFDGLDKNLSHSLLYDMLRIRLVEEGIAALYPEQEIRCPVHLCIGQEAIPVGVCANLLKDDIVMGNHRSHGHYLAKGGGLNAMMAEIYGKATGCSKGIGGSMHLIDLSVNFMGTTPIVASIIPVAVGTAFSSLMKNEARVTVIFFGRGATEEGVFAESLNFASLKKLPIVFISEDNFYSVYSPLSERQPAERDNVALAKAFGIPGCRGDGNNVQIVYELAQKAINHCRDQQGPYFLELETYRWREHCGPNYDNDIGYRSESDYQKWKKKCPIENFEKKLMDSKNIEKHQIDHMRQTIIQEFEGAVDFAKSSPLPSLEDISKNLFKEINANPISK